MKPIFILITLLSSTLLQASNGWVSGGGDPILVKAQDFPYMGRIKDAVNFLSKNLDKTPFNERFKGAFREDMTKMLKMGRFYYIPDLFSVGFNRYPGDYNTLVSNGAMTEFYPGAPIWFSKQALEYDLPTLARVIAQEVPHHIFKGRFQRDEVFANNLGTYLVLLDKIPTEPYNAAQIIYEEFDNKLRDESSQKIIDRAYKSYLEGKDVLNTLYKLSHDLYKNRGSFSDYHVEFGYFADSKLGDKAINITNLKKLQKEKIAKCMFTTYQDGPSGVTEHYQEILTKVFTEALKDFGDKIDSIYYLEDFYLPATKVISHCGIGVKSTEGKTYVFKSVRRQEDNQCELGRTCLQ